MMKRMFGIELPRIAPTPINSNFFSSILPLTILIIQMDIKSALGGIKSSYFYRFGSEKEIVLNLMLLYHLHGDGALMITSNKKRYGTPINL